MAQSRQTEDEQPTQEASEEHGHLGKLAGELSRYSVRDRDRREAPRGRERAARGCAPGPVAHRLGARPLRPLRRRFSRSGRLGPAATGPRRSGRRPCLSPPRTGAHGR
jgi:hypothetical protein